MADRKAGPASGVAARLTSYQWRYSLEIERDPVRRTERVRHMAYIADPKGDFEHVEFSSAAVAKLFIARVNALATPNQEASVEPVASPTKEQEGWGLPLRVVEFDRPVGTPDSEVEGWIAIVGAEYESDEVSNSLIELPTELLDEWVRDFFTFVVRCVNALAGMNPEALPKLIQELDSAMATGFDLHAVRWIGRALAKLRGEVGA